MFLHVGDNDGQPDPEHPCQGSLPDLKLDWQPPAQLPVFLSSFASFAVTESDAADGA
jgi:hypothetical protein